MRVKITQVHHLVEPPTNLFWAYLLAHRCTDEHEPCDSKCGPRGSNSGNTGDPVNSAESQVPPQSSSALSDKHVRSTG